MVDLYVPQTCKRPGVPNFDGGLSCGEQEGAVGGEGEGADAGAVAAGVDCVQPFRAPLCDPPHLHHGRGTGRIPLE